MSMYDYYEDDRECEHCGETVEVEGTYAEAYGTCTNCGGTTTVYRMEELQSDADEQAIDAARDARFE